MALPLFQRFPGTEHMPWVQLCDLPTPLEPLSLDVATSSLLVKRDDLTSRLYGGNKVRKLEFLLGEAIAEKRSAVLTFGAYGSNHALATAVHATALGLEPHVVLSPQEPGPFAAATLRAHAGLGSSIHLIDGWDGRREAVAVKRELTRRDGVEPCIIPMGGTSPMGVAGYVNAAFELLDQGNAPDVVYVAGGTLGTAVGLALGFAAANTNTRVVSVRVTPGEVANAAFAERLSATSSAMLNAFDPGFPVLSMADLNLELRDDWFEPGYGVVTPETTAAVETAWSAGVKLETTYTGKAMAALMADARAGLLGDKRVLFVNTYNSAPMPQPGEVSSLPEALQEYVAICDEMFGPILSTPTEGDSE